MSHEIGFSSHQPAIFVFALISPAFFLRDLCETLLLLSLALQTVFSVLSASDEVNRTTHQHKFLFLTTPFGSVNE
jgi:hypothetical protein